jgi:hypothetical protein
MIRYGDRNDYNSVISNLTQFQTQDFHGIGIAGVHSNITGDDDKTQSENDKSQSSSNDSDNEALPPDSPPRASLHTFSLTAPAKLSTKRHHKPTLKQQSQTRHINKKKAKRRRRKQSTMELGLAEGRRERRWRRRHS